MNMGSDGSLCAHHDLPPLPSTQNYWTEQVSMLQILHCKLCAEFREPETKGKEEKTMIFLPLHVTI